MKNIYKNYLRKVNKEEYSNVYSDLVGICYKLGYTDMARDIDSYLLPALLEYNKGDNGKYYNLIKKWIKGIRSDKELLQVFNICNLGIRQGLYLDKLEDKSESNFEPAILNKVYDNLEPVLYSGEYTTRYSVFSSRELSTAVTMIKSSYQELYLNPKLEHDKEQVISRMRQKMIDMAKSEGVSSEDTYDMLRITNKYYSNYMKIANDIAVISNEIQEAARLVFSVDKSFLAIDTIEDFTDLAERKLSRELYNHMRSGNYDFRGNTQDMAGMKSLKKLTEYMEANSSSLGKDAVHNYVQQLVSDTIKLYKDFLTIWQDVHITYTICPKELVKDIILDNTNDTQAVLTLKVYLDSIKDNVSQKYIRDFNLLLEYINSIIGSGSGTTFDKDTSNIESYNSGLFYICLGIKLCLFNNSKVIVNDFKSKVDERSMISYLKNNCERHLKDLIGDQYMEIVNQLLSGNPDTFEKYGTVMTKPYVEYIYNKDSNKFIEACTPMFIAQNTIEYVNYYFLTLQDKNIGAYMTFLSDNLFTDCMDGVYVRQSLVHSLIYESDLSSLYNRKYIIPTKGIVAELLSYSYYLREYDNELNEHCISAIIRYDNSTYGSLIINLSTGTAIGMNIEEYHLEIIKKILDCTPSESRKSISLGLQVNSDEIGINVYSIQEDLASLVPEITSPYYWKYRGEYRQSSPLAEHSPVTSDKEIVVSAFVRRLPNGGIASKERQDLARRYCIKLEDGYTIVDSFTRKSVEGSTRTMSSFSNMI